MMTLTLTNGYADEKNRVSLEKRKRAESGCSYQMGA